MVILYELIFTHQRLILIIPPVDLIGWKYITIYSQTDEVKFVDQYRLRREWYGKMFIQL